MQEQEMTAFWTELRRNATGTRLVINCGKFHIESADEFSCILDVIEHDLYRDFGPGWSYGIFHGPESVFKKIEETRLTCEF